MAKSFAEQITQQLTDLQQENEKLRSYEKLFDKYLKIEFGVGKKEIDNLLKKPKKNEIDFAEKICSFFGLKSDADRAGFLAALCSDSGTDFVRRNCIISNGENGYPQQG